MSTVPRDTIKGKYLRPREVVLAGTTANTNIALTGIKRGDILISVIGYKTDGTDVKVWTDVTSITSNGNIQSTEVTTGYNLLVKYAKQKVGKLGVSSFSILPATVTLDISNGETQQIASTAVFDDGRSLAVTGTATYVSSDPTKATVNSLGLITPVAAGSATITATYEGLQDTVVVTVQA